jgi:hypothetical protein
MSEPLLFHAYGASLAVVFVLASAALSGADFPDAENLPVHPGLPDPLVLLDGKRVTSGRQWLEDRRPELKALFQHYMYGAIPPRPERLELRQNATYPDFLGGKATLKLVTVTCGPEGAPRIDLMVVIPNARRRPAPVFLAINFCGNHTVTVDPRVPLTRGHVYAGCRGPIPGKPSDEERGSQEADWALDQTIERGYALATFHNGDVDGDSVDAPGELAASLARAVAGRAQRPATGDRGTIALWAWGFHRAVDYLVTDPDLDARRISIVGHSRNGKTALLAAAFDERIALAIPHQAGCGGTAPSRGKVGESVKQINEGFPHWFNAEFKKFNEHPERLPFDQHSLVALCAPRPVLFSNAVEDTWANPDGQFEMLKAAEPVYRLLQAGGLESAEKPEMGKLSGGVLGYFIRAGQHSMTREDWKAFLDFADRNLPPRA